MTDANCDMFATEGEELALGLADDPQSSALLRHASECADCGEVLSDLVSAVDGLLGLAPEAEPPVGFEALVVAGMSDHIVPMVRSRRPRRAYLAAAAATCITLGLIGGIAVGRTTAPSERTDLAASVISRDGEDMGSVELYSKPIARVVVVLDPADKWGGVWECDLQREDGTWVQVGTWVRTDAPTGAWAAPIAKHLLNARAMRITKPDGKVVATARFA